jgi:ribosomal protein S3
MGQKTNPNILRIGKIKDWKSKYIEKKKTDSSILIFRDLEIKKFISQLFEKNGLKIQNCRIYYSESSVHIYISYYNGIKPLLYNEKIRLRYAYNNSSQFQKKTMHVMQNATKKRFYLMKSYKKSIAQQSRAELLQRQYFFAKKTQRLSDLKNFKTCLNKKKHPTLDQQNNNLFVSMILKNLNLFTNSKHNIFINLKQANKESNFLQTVLKTDKRRLGEDIAKLRKFQQNEFFRNGFTILHNFATNHHSSTFLAEFIAVYLKKLKRPNFFLRFLKLALKTLLKKKFTLFERIQIKIKGRFNGAPRSSHKFINVGKNIPVLTINAKIDYGKATAYTSNGTFGVKVWTYATNSEKQLCLTRHKTSNLKKLKKEN